MKDEAITSKAGMCWSAGTTETGALRLSEILHGGDYNPDQWLNHPDILEEDIRLMKKAFVNCVSLGIFAWAKLEPEEGRYEFEWLEAIIQKLYENGIYTILATPTAAMPQWLTEKYEEVMQVDEYGLRNLPGNRHNFCPSSHVMREKMRQMNRGLSKRLGSHPGVIAWHISNEYGGNGRDSSCHCPLCQDSFRSWLKEKYETLDALNHAWWTSFWSHTYTDWKQIRSASARGENLLHGLNLDWKRFVSRQLLAFCKEEIQAVRQYSNLPTTVNMMGFFKHLNYFEWAREVDIISWDSYPSWHSEKDEIGVAVAAAAQHSMMRSFKKAPFLLMESTPSFVNYKPKNTLKRPGLHSLSSLQAIAHGSNSVQYFQWRKSRGSCEKFHGAVIDHKNNENTRVFRDVTEVGKRLKALSDRLYNTCNQAKVAIVYDWENRWAMEDAYAVEYPMDYTALFLSYYRPLWEMGIDADVLDMKGELDGYRLVIAPLNYMYRGDYADRVRRFVEAGGCYVTTYWSGEVDDTDLCFLGGHPLRDVLGIRTEEIDAPGDYYKNQVEYAGSCYNVTGLCGLVHAQGAKVLATYKTDFFKGFPALTENTFGRGKAYYIASQNENAFIRAVYEEIFEQAGMNCGFKAELGEGVTVACRTGERIKIWFLQNFNRDSAVVKLKGVYRDMETQEVLEGDIKLEAFTCLILEEAASTGEFLN